MASITREFIDSALVEFLGIIVHFRFCVLLYGNRTLKGNSYVSMLEEVCDFPYFWAVVGEGCPFFVFIFFVVLILVVFICCICSFRSCNIFTWKLLFFAVFCITFHS